VERDNKAIAVARQCELIGLSRSYYYYSSTQDDEYNLELMRLLDEQYTKVPFYGVRRMTAWLRARGYIVNPKRVRMLMWRMALQAIFPHKRRSFSSPGHQRYPYLLEGLEIERPDQVWIADITYIRLAHGFVYLVVVMDWYSRYVLSWELFNTLDSRFCVEALSKALWSSRPEIFNIDQGVQFTAREFSELLSRNEVKISMDGRGRVYDNI
jgi:Transposase and inactivated derivatives